MSAKNYQRTCQKCQGAGEIHWNDGSHRGGFYGLAKCRRCNGTGKVTAAPKSKGTT